MLCKEGFYTRAGTGACSSASQHCTELTCSTPDCAELTPDHPRAPTQVFPLDWPPLRACPVVCRARLKEHLWDCPDPLIPGGAFALEIVSLVLCSGEQMGRAEWDHCQSLLGVCREGMQSAQPAWPRAGLCSLSSAAAAAARGRFAFSSDGRAGQKQSPVVLVTLLLALAQHCSSPGSGGLHP